MKTNPKIIVEFLNTNLHHELTLEIIAAAVKLSRSRVCDLIKSETGMPPGVYIKTLRMERAYNLLRATSLEIKQVMLEVGIKDSSHFARDFKHRYGLTPSEHRAQRVAEQMAEASSDETK